MIALISKDNKFIMKILDGKKLAEKILQYLKKKVSEMKEKPVLAVILVGSNRASEAYIEQKRLACESVGVGFSLFSFSENTDKNELKEEIAKIVNNPKISGAIIQLPLPKKFNQEEFLNLIPESKDVDVLSENSFSKFCAGSLNILPPTVGAITRLLEEYGIGIKEKNIVVVGSGRLVGLPLSIYLASQKASVSVLNSSTKNPELFMSKADILISGVGKKDLIKGNMIKKGVVVVDAGSSSEEGKVTGDVHFASVSKKASFIAPVPGGVGPMTVACLLENLIKLKDN